MGNFWCNYCGTKLTHDSISVRKKHFRGRNHISNAKIYWEMVTKEIGQSNKETALDQTAQLRAVLTAPGLDATLENIEANLNAALPEPKLYY